MKTEIIEVVVDKRTDSFAVAAYLNTFKGIKAGAVTYELIRVRFNPEKIAAKLILKMIARATKTPGNRSRKRNVKSVRSVNEKNQAA